MSNIQALVDRATDSLLPSADWTINFQVVDAINSNTNLCVQCHTLLILFFGFVLLSFLKLLPRHFALSQLCWFTSKFCRAKPFCQAIQFVLEKRKKRSSVLAIELLETLLKNCPSTYKFVGSHEYLKELIACAVDEGATSVRAKALDWIQFFGVAFQTAKDLHFTSIYTMLKVRGIKFPQKRDEEWAPEGYKSADKSGSPYAVTPDANAPITGENLYFKITSLTNTLNLFQELISKLQPGEEKNNEVVNELYTQCKVQQKQVVEWLEGSGATLVQSNVLDQLINLNNQLLKLISRWEKIQSDPTILQRRHRRADQKHEQEDPMAAIVNRKRPPRAIQQPQQPSPADSPLSSPFISPMLSPIVKAYRAQQQSQTRISDSSDGEMYVAAQVSNMLDLI